MIHSPIILSNPLSKLHHSFLSADTVIQLGGTSHTNAAFINQHLAKNEKEKKNPRRCTRRVRRGNVHGELLEETEIRSMM